MNEYEITANVRVSGFIFDAVSTPWCSTCPRSASCGARATCRTQSSL